MAPTARRKRESLYLRINPEIKEALQKFASENHLSLNTAAELHLEAAISRGIEYRITTRLITPEENGTDDAA